MTSDSDIIFITFDQKKQTSSNSLTLASCAFSFGLILGTSALMMWPICVLEEWNSDYLINSLLVCAFFLLFAACHYFDCVDERKVPNSSKSL